MKFDLINRPEPEGVHYEGNERFEGYAVDLLYNLAEECKFDFHFEPVRDNKYGSYDAVSDEWDGIIRQLIDNVSSTYIHTHIHTYMHNICIYHSLINLTLLRMHRLASVI